VNWGVDFQVETWGDLRMAEGGDPCPRCQDGFLELRRAIELGHLFKLGTRYSEALGARVDTEEGHQAPATMGCYGLGISRCVAAVVEAHHDDDGICWPMAVAPFHVGVLQVEPTAEAAEAAGQIVGALEAAGWEVLLDDREERAGVKFKDADLVGYPVQVVVGKKLAAEGVVEVRRRRDREQRLAAPADVPAAVAELAGDA
jgi:prolyl-tRNA synthetase